MRWEGGRESENVEDRRRLSGGAVLGGGATILIVVVCLALGVDPRDIDQVLKQANQMAPQQQVDQGPETPEQQRSRQFAATILGFTEDVWTEQFQRIGQRYRPPHMVLFSESVDTRCGQAPSAVGPFYCPGDQTVYLDPTFFDELEQRLGGSRAEFSQAYVIAHEVGHHVQHLLGFGQIVDQKRHELSKKEFNKWSVRLELQADYLAGVWAHYGQQRFNFIEKGDVEAAIQSANAIGDDRLQKRSTGFVSPEKFTHGTSAQRVKWFRLGLQTGDIRKIKELFEMPYEEL